MSDGELKKGLTAEAIAMGVIELGKPFSKGKWVPVGKIDEAKKDIPKALMYGTPEQEDGYDHDDVVEMMDWIKKQFGDSP